MDQGMDKEHWLTVGNDSAVPEGMRKSGMMMEEEQGDMIFSFFFFLRFQFSSYEGRSQKAFLIEKWLVQVTMTKH
tara:strand:+ start:1268 stop:1492 length:225 start_codon:yes stop_codon:yes gene_type:complete